MSKTSRILQLTAKDRRRIHLRERVKALEDFIEDYRLRVTAELARNVPSIPDLFCHPLIRKAIDHIPAHQFHKAIFDNLVSPFPDIVTEVIFAIQSQAAAIIQEASGDTRPDVLGLATSLFSCSLCHSTSAEQESHLYVSETLRFPDIIYHPCASFSYKQIKCEENDVDLKWFAEFHNKANWNRYGQISYQLENRRVISNVITLSGFDPHTATMAQMDQADPIFECTTCNDAAKGRATLRWSLVAAHNKECHINTGTSMKLELLSEKASCAIRKRMDEQMERERAELTTKPIRYYNNSMTCAHCHFYEPSESVAVRQHVKREHGISRPTDKDIVPIPSKRFIQSVFFLWPPRGL